MYSRSRNNSKNGLHLLGIYHLSCSVLGTLQSHHFMFLHEKGNISILHRKKHRYRTKLACRRAVIWTQTVLGLNCFITSRIFTTDSCLNHSSASVVSQGLRRTWCHFLQGVLEEVNNTKMEYWDLPNTPEKALPQILFVNTQDKGWLGGSSISFIFQQNNRLASLGHRKCLRLSPVILPTASAPVQNLIPYLNFPYISLSASSYSNPIPLYLDFKL